MMSQREIAKAEIVGDLAKRAGKLGFGLEASNIPDERIYTIEHPRLRLRRGTVFQVTSVPQRPLRKSTSRPVLNPESLSAHRASMEVTSARGAFKYIHLLVTYLTRLAAAESQQEPVLLRILAERFPSSDPNREAAERPLR